MAIIKHVQKDSGNNWNAIEHSYDGLAWEWICDNIDKGENFHVYDGFVCEENEISRDNDAMRLATDVTVISLPAADPFTWVAIVVAVVSVAITLLIPEVDVDVNNQVGSANNELSNRSNKLRINERIVDIVGQVKSIPDIIQKEYSYFDEDQKEVRVGIYCFGRNTIDIQELSDGENLISDINGASAGIYRPYTSPNNSSPYQQIGDDINEPVVGVYESSEALGQTLEPPKVFLDYMEDETVITANFTNKTLTVYLPNTEHDDYEAGDYIRLVNTYILKSGVNIRFGYESMRVISNTINDTLILDLSDSPSALASLVDGVSFQPEFNFKPSIQPTNEYIGDTYLIKRQKINRMLVNVYGPNGIYKRKSSAKEDASVQFTVAYYRLSDNFTRIGSLQTATKTITGATDSSIGETIDINLGSPTYIEWYVYRNTSEDLDYNGTVSDTIKLKSMFGLFDVDVEHFGNVTIVQTKRKQIEQVTSTSNPEVNAIATEMVYKYLGNGVFDTELTTNTQAMQSLISQALDTKIGRLTVNDLDLDLLVQTQEDNETYYQTDSAGKCSYSFDTLDTSAQEAFFLIANAASVILWREGRTLKSWFEKPQSVPEMIFTHRSKLIDEETWDRTFKLENDGVEFPYIDADTNTQETYTYPENAINPKKIDYKGFRGEEQAIWRALREYHKLTNQRVSVDFTATAEGRFVKPSKLIGVVKGTRVGQTGGYIVNVDLLTVELSQEVSFTDGDDHFLVLKTRNGGTQTVSVTATNHPRIVVMDFAPIEPLYYGNDELKTEFSFGNEARLLSQLMMPQTIDASERYSTKITAVNYSNLYYQGDPISPINRAYSDAYSSAYS